MEDTAGRVLEVQKQLEKDGLRAVVDKYKLKAKRHKDHPNLVCLHYTQNKSKMKHTVVQECRGIVLDEEDGWRAVCFPYEKFFNYKEKEAAKVQWGSSCKIFPKLDGSIATLYWYKDEWHVASSTLPDGSGPLIPGLSFSDVFWDVWKAVGYQYPDPQSGMCFMFEMLDPRHKIICDIARQDLVLHGVRRLACFTEIDHEPVAQSYGWRYTEPITHLETLEHCVDAAALMNPKKEEGYVVRDHAFRRVKVKSPAYVNLSYMSSDGKATGPRLLDVSIRGESAEFGSYFPHYAGLLSQLDSSLEQLSSAYDPVLTYISENYETLSMPKVKFYRQVVAPNTPDPEIIDITVVKSAANDCVFSFMRYLKSIPRREAWGLLKSLFPCLTSLFVEDKNGLVTMADDCGAVRIEPATVSREKGREKKNDCGAVRIEPATVSREKGREKKKSRGEVKKTLEEPSWDKTDSEDAKGQKEAEWKEVVNGKGKSKKVRGSGKPAVGGKHLKTKNLFAELAALGL
eukprot:TRINITY_DN3230_c0_g1_i1.p1 TRINITY_DN3230_c0_g1~~TRINITY_DN3230_c0_g1_i1.p1  ORF type:complete len:532 (+),score=128.81 TRINITY_DN3230_c0_g1_i1:56-1597(+)